MKKGDILLKEGDYFENLYGVLKGKIGLVNLSNHKNGPVIFEVKEKKESK